MSEWTGRIRMTMRRSHPVRHADELHGAAESHESHEVRASRGDRVAGDVEGDGSARPHERRRLLVIAGCALLAVALAVPSLRQPTRHERSDDPARSIESTRVDVNRATAAELQVLPGIGPALAERIIAERTAHGSFASLDELERVHGIGPRTIDRLGPFIELVRDDREATHAVMPVG